MPKKKPRPPELIDLRTALTHFAFPNSSVQSSDHIRRLHWYVACRLVIEGGFDPEQIVPRPPFRIRRRGRRRILLHDESVAKGGEMTVVGGLKTKKLDVTVIIPTVGPVVAISLKGTHNAIRNLTNRMEEAAGDCTNIHTSYPALVYGFWHVIRANEEDDREPQAHFNLESGRYKGADLSILSGGRPSEGIERYAHALERLSDREDLRDSVSRYEACGLTLVKCQGGQATCGVFEDFPDTGSRLTHNHMFRRLYEIYDRRYVYQAPALQSHTERNTWDAQSPALVKHILAREAFEEMSARIG